MVSVREGARFCVLMFFLNIESVFKIENNYKMKFRRRTINVIHIFYERIFSKHKTSSVLRNDTTGTIDTHFPKNVYEMYKIRINAIL